MNKQARAGVTLQPRFVRPKIGLPLTGMLVGKGADLFGAPIYHVIQYGYSKPEVWYVADVSDYVPNRLMAEQLNRWLTLIDWPVRVSLL